MTPQPPFPRPQNHTAWIGTIYNGVRTGSVTNVKSLSSFMGVSQNVLWKVKGIDNYFKAVCQYVIDFVNLKKTNYLFVYDCIVVSTFKTKHVYELLIEPETFHYDLHVYSKQVDDEVIVEYITNNIVCLEKVSAKTAKIETVGLS